jgi:hypothetical protein
MARQKTERKTVPTRAALVGGASVTPLRVVSVKSAAAKMDISHDQIARRAYEMWLKQGGRHGHDLHHWFEAEKELKAELGID